MPYFCKLLIALPLFIGLVAPAPASERDSSGVPVVTAIAQNEDVFRILQLTGSVTAARASRLSPATSGLVAALQVDTGSRVEKGAILMQLDEELAQWQADGAAAAVEQARLALRDARRRLAEARKLAPQQSIAESAVRDLAAEVAQDETALQQAEAEAGFRRGVLQRHQVRAPFAGVVSAKLTELGEWVDTGQPVLELVALENVHLDFPVAEDYAADIHAGATLRYAMGADAAARFEGRVSTVVPVTNPGARTILLRVTPVEQPDQLIPGMSVRGSLQLATGRRAVVIPRDGLMRSPAGRNVVWTVVLQDGENVVRENVVTTGLSFDAKVEITGGLQPGAQIVVRGNEALQSGQRVTIRKTGPG